MKIIKAFLILSAFLSLTALAHAAAVTDEFDPLKREIHLSIIDETEAQELFQFFKSQEHLAFDYAPDCCYARAMQLTLLADRKGLNMAKVFLEGTLSARVPDSKYEAAVFNWHVAPVIYVKKKTGQTVLMAFDPAFFDGPVEIEEFKSRFTQKVIGWPAPNVTQVYFGTKFQNQALSIEGHKFEYQFADLKKNSDDLKRCLSVAREGNVTEDQFKRIDAIGLPSKK